MSCQTESYQYSNYKFAVFPANRTEQMLMNRIRDYDFGWTKYNNTHRVMKIGVQANCNGELCKYYPKHAQTADEIITFFKKNNVDKYTLETIDTKYEYSNRIKLENDEYDKLEKIIKMTN
jgi:hypothetical protein